MKTEFEIKYLCRDEDEDDRCYDYDDELDDCIRWRREEDIVTSDWYN